MSTEHRTPGPKQRYIYLTLGILLLTSTVTVHICAQWDNWPGALLLRYEPALDCKTHRFGQGLSLLKTQSSNTSEVGPKRLVNLSGAHDVKRIFYNRVPKCGSRSVKDVITYLSKHNNFKFFQSSVYLRMRISAKQQRAAVHEISRLPVPMIYDRHLHYLNFTRFNVTQPLYINVVRDPLDRLVTWYYYIRHGSGGGKHPWMMKAPDIENTRNLSFDECVSRSLQQCTHPDFYYTLVPFFCGHDPFCREPGRRSLSAAVHNLLQHYILVGITEDLDKFFVALELLLPDFFANASVVYNNTVKRRWSAYKTRNKTSISHKTREAMMTLLTEEYEFYHLAKKHFFDILQALLQPSREDA